MTVKGVDCLITQEFINAYGGKSFKIAAQKIR